MAPLLLIALLPLDLADPTAAASDGTLRVEAVVDGGKVAADLVNGSGRAVHTPLGMTCSGPLAFTAWVDGVEHGFAEPGRDCHANAIDWADLAPGERRRVPSRLHVGPGAHQVVVRYRPDPGLGGGVRGELRSNGLVTGGGPLQLELRAQVGAVRDGAQVAVEVVHRWRGATQLRFLRGWLGVCAAPKDGLRFDGQARPMVEPVACDGPAAPDWVTVQPGGSFTTRGMLIVAPGRHRLRAVYDVEPPEIIFWPRKDNVGEYAGHAESAEIALEVPGR